MPLERRQALTHVREGETLYQAAFAGGAPGTMEGTAEAAAVRRQLDSLSSVMVE
jgi:hypothetical protein